ncbi:MAG: YihY family inner membrane protein [Mariprofundaceae bacterium]|nr:YihY family inner membrane protein [Mariprofundaceae bacterium]
MSNGLKQRLAHILEMDVTDIASLPALKRHLTNMLRFTYRVILRFLDDHCIERASALAFALLLAIIPLVALGFSVFTSFQAFNTTLELVRDTLLQFLLPTSREIVQGYLSTIAGKAAALSIFGIIGLLLTATALLNTMEESFNHIWRISRTRPLLSKFITFWATLTLAPLLIGASITITSYFTALPIIQDVAEGASAIGRIPFLIPWLMSSLALAGMYYILPNTHVPFRFALVGGLVAGALFELSKLGFAFYVTDLANYERVYGALGTLPIFLIWLYLIWVVVLIGAEIVFCLQHPEQSHKHRSAFLRPGIQQFFSYLAILRATQAAQEGRALNMGSFLAETGVPSNIMQEWLDRLCDKGLLRNIGNAREGEGWVPAVSAGQLRLIDIHHALNPAPMQIPEEWLQTPLGRTLNGLYFRMEREQKGLLANISIRDMVRKEEEEAEYELLPDDREIP